jgi:carbonic anhydrase
MGVIDDVIKANEDYAAAFDLAHLSHHPARNLAVVACMDTRMNMEHILGLRTGDAHIIRNAGGIVTDDALRSLIVSHRRLGTQEVMIINHTECGMLHLAEHDFRASLEQATGVSTTIPTQFHAFTDLEENVREQLHNVRSHPWMSSELVVRGFIYDVRTGKLREVEVDRERGQAA